MVKCLNRNRHKMPRTGPAPQSCARGVAQDARHKACVLEKNAIGDPPIAHGESRVRLLLVGNQAAGTRLRYGNQTNHFADGTHKRAPVP